MAEVVQIFVVPTTVAGGNRIDLKARVTAGVWGLGNFNLDVYWKTDNTPWYPIAAGIDGNVGSFVGGTGIVDVGEFTMPNLPGKHYFAVHDSETQEPPTATGGNSNTITSIVVTEGTGNLDRPQPVTKIPWLILLAAAGAGAYMFHPGFRDKLNESISSVLPSPETVSRGAHYTGRAIKKGAGFAAEGIGGIQDWRHRERSY